MSARLAGKRCVIVGGTSGIGLACAKLFQLNGARVVVAGLEDSGAPAAFQVSVPPPFLPCDARSESSVTHLFEAAYDLLGGLDVLVHSAGGSARRHGDGPLHECSEAGWDWALETNLKTVFLTNRAAVRLFLRQRQPGVVLNVSTMLAYHPRPHYFDTCAYGAAKAGIIALSLSMAARYASDGIRVNVLAPGLIDTPMSQRAMNDEAVLAYLKSKQPLGPGPGTADDCAQAAVYLCSEEARFLTGVVLPVDGGWSLTDGQHANGQKEESSPGS